MTDPEILQDKLLGELMDDMLTLQQHISMLFVTLSELIKIAESENQFVYKELLRHIGTDTKLDNQFSRHVFAKEFKKLAEDVEGMKAHYTSETIPTLNRIKDFLDKKEVDKQPINIDKLNSIYRGVTKKGQA